VIDLDHLRAIAIRMPFVSHAGSDAGPTIAVPPPDRYRFFPAGPARHHTADQAFGLGRRPGNGVNAREQIDKADP
jgi:hypothetical protein